MKLIDLFEMPENAAASRVSDHNISPSDMQIVFDALRNRGELDKSEVKPLAAELVDEHGGYSKNAGSAQFVINRMHTIMHGMAPLGVSEQNAEQFMTPARPLIAFMSEKGYNPEEAINIARDEARTRIARMKRPPAVKAVMDYYRQIKSSLDPRQDKRIRANREQLIKAMMGGNKVDVVFDKVLA